VHLHLKSPRLTFSVHLSRASTLVLTLLDARGRTVALWREKGKKGTNTYSLLLPSKTRHAGHDKLRLTATGSSKPKLLAVALVA
jgi:hypothetical protein